MSREDVEFADLLDEGRDAWYDEWCPWDSYLTRSHANDYAVTYHPDQDARFVWEHANGMWRLYLERL
jgi:hypothetical protein